ncbi:MAG: SDR family oxidoreductase [Planctomycetota bacterium]
MTPDLHDQVALVTGAGRGIGRALTLALARRGATVVAAARTESQLHRVAAEAAGKVVPWRLDLTDADDVADVFRAVGERFARLDILINNAGLGLYGPVAEMPLEQFDRVLTVNLRGGFAACQQAMRLMIPRRRGYIINISSVVGFKGYPNQAAYTASKHGLMGLTKSLAVEAATHDIRVSAVLPGGVDTDMVAQARPDLDRSILIHPEDIATTVLYLLSLSDRAHVDQIYIRRRTASPF